ncbi:hypothetical protein C2S51_005936 [Perilla frutescens var. frutescens]|nr:hypothetical protein C2S51_005936 [Perilla frutescens var. frutescens]
MAVLDFPLSLMMRFVMFSSVAFIFVSCFMKRSYAFEDRKSDSAIDSHFHTVEISSLLPASVCSSSTIKGSNKRQSTLEVFHKHGPCSQQGSNKVIPSLSEVLSQDQSRVESIQARFNTNSNTSTIKSNMSSKARKPEDKKHNHNMRSEARRGSGNYVVAVGLGTPRRTVSLEFDTGSSLTWTQCQPCLGSCYEQQDPIFDPSDSSSYSNVSCNLAECSQLRAATGIRPGCDTNTCVYGIQYGDGSYTAGFLSRDKLALSAVDVIPNFVFGCGQNNQLIGNDAGILGLGRSSLSIVYQTANSSLDTTFYVIDILSITVGGRQLPIKQSVFKDAGSIIDSGTVITRLPPEAYSAMSTAFDETMRTKYPSAPAYSIFDTCYDITGYKTISIPTISFTFGGNVKVDLDAFGIVVLVSRSRVCLAFAGNRDANSIAIYGNTQQKTFEVVYDIAGGKIGFAPGGC